MCPDDAEAGPGKPMDIARFKASGECTALNCVRPSFAGTRRGMALVIAEKIRTERLRLLYRY